MTNAYSVTYWMYAGNESDAPLLFFTGSIPFVPHPGMRLAVDPNDPDHDCTLHTVERVDWMASRPTHLDVLVDTEDLVLVKYRIREGWRIYQDQQLDQEGIFEEARRKASTPLPADMPIAA